MNLLYILALISVLVVGSTQTSTMSLEVVGQGWYRIANTWLIFLLLLAAPGAALLQSAAVVRHCIAGDLNKDQARKLISTASGIAGGLWICCILVLNLLLLDGSATLAPFPLVSSILWSLACGISLMLIWAAVDFSWIILDRWGRHGAPSTVIDRGQAGAGALSARRIASAAREVASLVALRIRLQAPILLPALACVTIGQIAIHAVEFLAIDSRAVEPYFWPMLTIVLLAALLVVFPVAVSRVWRTEPVSDQLSALAREAMFEASGRNVPVRVWKTGKRVRAIMLVGVFPVSRFVLISDWVCDKLAAEQIRMLMRHEAAHLKRGHIWSRLAFLTLPLIGFWTFATASQSWIKIDPLIGAAVLSPQQPLNPTVLSTGFLGLDSSGWLLFLVGAIAWIGLAFGRFCREQEYQADELACFGPANDRRDLPSSRVELLCSALDTLHLSGNSKESGRGWLHPSVDERRRRLEARLAAG